MPIDTSSAMAPGVAPIAAPPLVRVRGLERTFRHEGVLVPAVAGVDLDIAAG